MVLSRLKATDLLYECTGDDIWSLEHCAMRGILESWTDELTDCFESNFLRDEETIYVQEGRTNQYEGIRDVDLAMKLGEFLGVDVAELQQVALSRRDLVSRIREAFEEG